MDCSEGNVAIEKADANHTSQKKLEANRRNAQLSTGPNTEEGKARSRSNAIKHGILASDTVIVASGEKPEEFKEILDAFVLERAPVGALEEALVERIAVCWWRLKRVARCESGIVQRALVPRSVEYDEVMNSARANIKDHLCLPSGADLDRILRYESSIQRQLSYAISQLERLQRVRKGEHVPAPVQVEVSSSD
jgi:hypothetical protein